MIFVISFVIQFDRRDDDAPCFCNVRRRNTGRGLGRRAGRRLVLHLALDRTEQHVL